MSIGFTLPPSKSQTMRALLFAFLAKGKSVIYNPLFSPDTNALCHALKLLGASIDVFPDRIEVNSSGKIHSAEDVIHCGNSGLILRLLGAISGLSFYPIVFTGDHSIRYQREVEPLLSGLRQFGCEAFSLRGEGAPIFVKGPMKKGRAKIKGEDSQPVSGLLMACAMGDGPFEIHVENPGETPWVDLTLSWLNRFNIPYERQGYEHFCLHGNAKLDGFTYKVAGDASSCLFPLVAALITEKKIHFENYDKDEPQGDKKCIDLLIEKGAKITNEISLKIEEGSFSGGEIDVNPFIDSLPILAVLACFGKEKTRLKGGAIARKKECDRVHVMATELTKMGAKIFEEEDGLTIYPSELKGAKINSHNDHRIAMALAVAGLRAKGETLIDNKECVKKSYPHFFRDLAKFI